MRMIQAGVRSARIYVPGFTLVELMVAMAIGLIVVLASVAFIVALAKASSEDIRVTRLTQEVRALSEVISREVRRARYVSDPIGLVAQGSGAVSNDLLEVRQVNVPGDCVVLTYDDPPDPPATGTLVSRAIYRAQDASGNWRIFLNPTSANCNGGTAISSPQIEVTALTFQQVGGFRVDQLVTARLREAPPDLQTLNRTFRQTVYVRSGQVN